MSSRNSSSRRSRGHAPTPNSTAPEKPRPPEQLAQLLQAHKEAETSTALADDLKYELSLNFPECDWKGAVNFHPRRHGVYGYLLAWSGCGGINLAKDLTLVNPFQSSGQTLTTVEESDGGSTLKCVGVIEKFLFNGAENDPILISAYVSRANAAALHGSFSGVQPKTDLQVSWYLIASEGAGEGWYEAAFTDKFANASANIDSEPDSKTGTGGHLRINIAHRNTPLTGTDGGEIDLRLYKFSFQMIPTPGKVNTLHFATSEGAKIARTWGTAPAAAR